MITKSVSISNPVYEVLSQLTGETNTDTALSIALKDLMQLKRQAIQNKIDGFEKKYGMDFAEFETACDDGRIPDPFSYESEKDTWDWEAAITDLAFLEEISQCTGIPMKTRKGTILQIVK